MHDRIDDVPVFKRSEGSDGSPQMPPRPLQVVADDRERAGGVIEALRARDDVTLEVARLGVGDFLVEDDFVVERKTLSDFAVSIVDARLFKQCRAMAAGHRRPVLILEGPAGEDVIEHVTRGAVQGALITVAVFFGVAVLRSCDAFETAKLLVFLAAQARRVATGALPRPGYRPKGKHARQLFVLQGLPGIGPGKAERLLQHFGSVQNVAVAPEADLAAVDGIGPVLAARIRWTLV